MPPPNASDPGVRDIRFVEPYAGFLRGYDHRYVLPVVPLACIAAALSLARVTGKRERDLAAPAMR